MMVFILIYFVLIKMAYGENDFIWIIYTIFSIYSKIFDFYYICYLILEGYFICSIEL